MSDYHLHTAVNAFKKWVRPIFLFTFIAGAGSILISLTLDNYFKSTATFYAASQDLSKPEKIFSATDIQFYGNDEDIDRILTIAHGKALVEFIIDSFNLYDHFDIDRDDRLAAYKVRKAFFRSYEVVKTKYGALELSYESKDPQFASEVANTALNKLNELAQNVLQEGQKTLIEFHQNSIDDKQKQIKILQDSLLALRTRYNVYSIESQNEIFAELITQSSSNLAMERGKLQTLEEANVPRDTIIYQSAKVNGLTSQLTSLRQDLSKFNNGKEYIAVMEDQMEKTRETLSYDQIRKKQLETALTSNPKAIHIIEMAEPPIRKSKPKRSILVLAATFLTFLFMSVGALLVDRYHYYKGKPLQ